ncbi:MAG: hypothetical protein M1830_005425 [Pleopsidium flavum]|nr:MAG: hypothetical protein M1830_005425 [Pleopsidium flavum]
MQAFWTSWALWEKMCFVVTIILGCMKLVYTRYKLRQYIAIASKKQAQQLELKQEGEVTQRRRNDVPFGIRAIESGIEVDGVWISRSNTPIPSSPSTFAAPSIDLPSLSSDNGPSDRMSSASNNSRLEMPQPLRLYPGASSGRPSTSSRAHNSRVERGVSVESVPYGSDSPNNEPSLGGRQTYQPRHSSHLRYSNPNILRDSTTLDALEGHRRNASGSAGTSEGSEDNRMMDRSSGSSDQSGSSQGHYVPKRPAQAKVQSSMTSPVEAIHLAPIDSLPFTESRRGNLDSLANHRVSHAAETGQLLPRVRRSGLNGDWTGSSQTPSRLSATGDYYTPYRPPPANNSQSSFATSYPFRASEMVTPEAPSFQSFIDNQPITAQQSDPLLQGAVGVSNHDHAHVLQSADANQRLRRSTHSRRVNSGFEILPTGTFDVQQQYRRQSEEWNQDLELGDRRYSKKLQKKRPESMHKAESSFTEQI